MTVSIGSHFILATQLTTSVLCHRPYISRSHHTPPNDNRNKIAMSEHSSADEETDVNGTFIHIRDEINSIHAETYNARKALIENLSAFTKRFEDIDGRLNRIEQLLLKRMASEEQDTKNEKPANEEDVNGESNDKATEDAQTVHKKGGSTWVEQTRNETTTKTIANSRPERVTRERKPPKKWADESTTKETTANKKKRKASETDEEGIPAPEEEKKPKKAKKAKKL